MGVVVAQFLGDRDRAARLREGAAPVLRPNMMSPAARVVFTRIGAAMLVSLLAILAISALGIYYLGDEAWSVTTAWVHVVVGGVIVLPFVWHVWIAPWRRMRVVKAVEPVASRAQRPRPQPALARRNTAR